MEKKISVKNLYLLIIICIGLVCLGIGSTYAVFTTSAEIENPITLVSNLTHDSNLIETLEVNLNTNETKSVTLNISNSSSDILNYVVWYLDEGVNIELGTSSGTPTGSLISNGSVSVVVDIRNNSDNSEKVTLGISSNRGSVVLGNNMKTVSSEKLPVIIVNLIDYIRNQYTSGTPTLITQATSNDSYYYSYQDTGKTWGLMNDGLKIDNTLDATTTGLATTVTDTTALTSGTEGNIRYFGPSDSVNNYIYFNCETYPDTNCELWRIIGIVDGKVKIIKEESIGDLAWDYDKNQNSSLTTYSNNWETSSLQEFLNGLYYNRGTKDEHTYLSENEGKEITTILYLSDIGITEATRNNNIISESTWYLGGYNNFTVYPNEIYKYERTNKVGTTIYSGNTFNITANIGITYASDYGYATDFSKCSSQLSAYNSSTNSYACRTNNWIYSSRLWLITPYARYKDGVMLIPESNMYNPFGDTGGSLNWMYADSPDDVRPVLYLDSELGIESEHEGTSTDPYRISV